jgi:hypothetical protein
VGNDPQDDGLCFGQVLSYLALVVPLVEFAGEGVGHIVNEGDEVEDFVGVQEHSAGEFLEDVRFGGAGDSVVVLQECQQFFGGRDDLGVVGEGVAGQYRFFVEADQSREVLACFLEGWVCRVVARPVLLLVPVGEEIVPADGWRMSSVVCADGEEVVCGVAVFECLA